MSIRTSLALVLLAGCGAATSATNTGRADACERACEAAAAEWSALADRAGEGASDTENEPLAAERAVALLTEHARTLEATPHEVSGDEAFALSNAMMDAIDEVGAELPGGLRERADDAAEAVLTDRGEQGSLRAARDALAVLEDIVRAVRPGSADDRALSRLSHRARDAANAYRDGTPENGDQRADRAEGTPLPEGVAEPVSEARQRAIDASTRVREECAIPRRLDVPSL